jgi:hypothetical protein
MNILMTIESDSKTLELMQPGDECARACQHSRHLDAIDIAIGRAQAQHARSAMLGRAESAAAALAVVVVAFPHGRHIDF